MTPHDIELPEHWQAFQYNEGWGSWEQVIPSAANKPGVVKAYTADQVVAAIEADRKRRQLEAEEVCAEAYQVVGSLLSDLGIFETHHAEKILDNLSQAKMVHDDVLPWTSFDRQRRDNDQQPFGYFRALPNGWTDCAATDEGAIALYERPQAQGETVAYLDLGVGGYIDVGTDLTDEELAALPKGRHMLAIIGTYGVDGYKEGAPQPTEPEKADIGITISHTDHPVRKEAPSSCSAEAEPVKVPSDHYEQIAGVRTRRVYHGTPEHEDYIKTRFNGCPGSSGRIHFLWDRGISSYLRTVSDETGVYELLVSPDPRPTGTAHE